MGVISFVVGACAGYYLRTTPFGINLGKKVFFLSKVLTSKIGSNYKLVLVVRDDLNMSRGKIASQCSHASVLAYKNASILAPETAKMWEALGQAKIVLKTSNESKLIELSKEAQKLGIITNIVCDSGRTEVVPGTKTVLAVGPGPQEIIDKVTAHLKLL